MKEIARLLFIIFLEAACGICLAFLYWMVSQLIFNKNGFFDNGKAHEVIYYLLFLLPPFIYCVLVYSKLKKQENKAKASTFLVAGITYLLVGFILLLISTDFYLLRG